MSSSPKPTVQSLRFLAVTVAATLSIAAGGEPPLVSAVKAGKVDTVRALLTRRADANSPEVDGTTALHYAAHYDNLAAADLLIKAGANVRAANRYGATPLWLACVNGSASMVERLLKAGADPNTKMAEGDTVLMTAARTGNVTAVKTLIVHGADKLGASRLAIGNAIRLLCGAPIGHAQPRLSS